jgi:peroxiredoxin
VYDSDSGASAGFSWNVLQALSLPDVQGKSVNLQTFAGKPLVVNFFHSGSCDWAGAAVSEFSADYA